MRTVDRLGAGDAPAALPYCAYPRLAEVERPRVLELPERLPVARLGAVERHRSRRYRATPLSALTGAAVLETAGVVAASFAAREPQCRHLRPPAEAPEALRGAVHADAFGSEAFGPWTRRSLLYWFIRLMVLTDPTSPRGAVRTNAAALEQSLAIVDGSGRVIGGAFNETMPGAGAHPALRAGDPFLDAVLSYVGPVLEMLAAQDAAGLEALRSKYPEFRAAHDAGRVGHHFMVARSELLSKADTFELVAASVERYRELGFTYMMVEATNQWTGAACEALGGVRVHYWPFLAERVAPATGVAIPESASSWNGRLSDKDSGSMLYVVGVG